MRTIDYIRCESCDEINEIFEDDDVNQAMYCFHCHYELN
jgi:formylmethanofuran dehydrogenase subunit E